jgi:hypothetical protein
MTNRPSCCNFGDRRRGWVGYPSNARRGRRFGSGEIKKTSDIDRFLHLQRSAAVARSRPPQRIRHEITFEYQLLIDPVESPLRTRYSGSGRRKFGRIYQRFWVRSPLRFVARAIR